MLVTNKAFKLILSCVTLFFIFFIADSRVELSIHAIIYCSVTAIMVYSMFKIYPRKLQRFIGSFIHIILLIIQLIFLSYSEWVFSHRVISVFLLFLSFATEYYILRYDYKEYIFSIVDENSISFEDLKHLHGKIIQKKNSFYEARTKINIRSIAEIMLDLPRNSSTRYITKDTLSTEYFKNLNASIDDTNIYLVLSDTGSTASDFLSVFTHKTYNHISIAFDSDLKTLISYNGGEKVTPPGLNPEMVEWFHKKEDASIRIYKLKVTCKQKHQMIDKIKQINAEGSAYNLLGIAIKKSFRPNIMFCSQFVYCLLELVDAQYFTKASMSVKPTDFIELDYDRRLEFIETIHLSNLV
ncbi:MAG: hypothetical protein R3Y47_11695 [Lachnospiraceae bacterium]